MNELLELEPRETDADELDVDTAFSRIADTPRAPGQTGLHRGDDLSHGSFETSNPW